MTSKASTLNVLIIQALFLGMAPTFVMPADSARQYMDISVKETAGLDCLRPVSGGVPLAKGVAPEGSRFVLLDRNNNAVPCQSEVLARWQDGSIRWVLIDFQARPQPHGTDRYRLEWAARVEGPQPSE